MPNTSDDIWENARNEAKRSIELADRCVQLAVKRNLLEQRASKILAQKFYWTRFMKASLVLNLFSIVCVICAATMAIQGITDWGWFLFVGLITLHGKK